MGLKLIRADEIYCTDNNLSDDDVYHPLDWNTDGLVNLYEYNYFARAWLSHDPNDPALDPNDVRYDPNLSTPICHLSTLVVS